MNPATSPQNTPKNSTPQQLAGRTLRMMREAHQVGLRDLADKVGISASHLSRIESGERAATPDVHERLLAVIAALPTPAAAS